MLQRQSIRRYAFAGYMRHGKCTCVGYLTCYPWEQQLGCSSSRIAVFCRLISAWANKDVSDVYAPFGHVHTFRVLTS